MAFIPLKRKAKEQRQFQREVQVWVENASSIHVWWRAAVLWRWPLAWAEEGESSSSFVGHREGRSSPFANRHEQGAHFQHGSAGAGDRWVKRLCCWLCTAEICPVSHPPPACVLRSVKIWFPDCFLAGSQPEGVNHSTTVQQPGLPSDDHSLPTKSPWSRKAPSVCLLTSSRLWAGVVPALLLTWSGNLQRTI